jgi:hypothetical protein
VDKAKIDVIGQLPPPTNVKGIHSFLGRVGFYQRFIQNFFSDCSTPHASSSQRCHVRLHGRVPSIVPHFE